MSNKKTNTAVKEAVAPVATDNSALFAQYLAEVSGLPTKSAKIRALAAKGMKVGEIAKTMGILYQHARNVLKTELKKGPQA